jgi:DNA (cytosine-5)-methyltransferase 1
MGYFIGLALLGFCPTIVGVDTVASRVERYEAMNDELIVAARTDGCRPFEGVLGDALEFTATHGDTFHLNHGSPTCTGYSRGTAAIPDRLQRYDRLIPVFREVAESTGRPYVIENVADARPELRDPILLCGRMFGLEADDDDGTRLTLDRHRLFETSAELRPPEHPRHGWASNARDGVQVAGSYGGARRDKHEARHVRKGGYVPSAAVQRRLLGVPWMTEKGCQLSIPPMYTSWLAMVLFGHLDPTRQGALW